MEEGKMKASPISASERAQEKWRNLREKRRKLLAGVISINTEATTSATSGSGYTFSSPASAANDEVAVLHVSQVEKGLLFWSFAGDFLLIKARISTEEGILEIQLVVTSTGTSPETQYYSCTDAEQDDDDRGNHKVYCRRNSSIRSISLETNNFSSMDVQQGNVGNENCEPCCRRDGSKREILEWIFAIANFFVELLSIVFDQLSSQRKSGFLPVCMGMSILAVLICLCELVCKIRKEEATWKRKGSFPWFYHPSGVRFGSFADVVGLACACGQCIITTINYSLFLKHGNAPIKVSIWPSIFAFGQLCSKMWGEANCKQNVHKRESSSADLTSLV